MGCSYSKCPPGVSNIPWSESVFVGSGCTSLTVFTIIAHSSYSCHVIDSNTTRRVLKTLMKKSCYHDCSLMEQCRGQCAEVSRNIQQVLSVKYFLCILII